MYSEALSAGANTKEVNRLRCPCLELVDAKEADEFLECLETADAKGTVRSRRAQCLGGRKSKGVQKDLGILGGKMDSWVFNPAAMSTSSATVADLDESALLRNESETSRQRVLPPVASWYEGNAGAGAGFAMGLGISFALAFAFVTCARKRSRSAKSPGRAMGRLQIRLKRPPGRISVSRQLASS